MILKWYLGLDAIRVETLGMLGWGEWISNEEWMWIFRVQKTDCSGLNNDPQRYQALVTKQSKQSDTPQYQELEQWLCRKSSQRGQRRRASDRPEGKAAPFLASGDLNDEEFPESREKSPVIMGVAHWAQTVCTTSFMLKTRWAYANDPQQKHRRQGSGRASLVHDISSMLSKLVAGRIKHFWSDSVGRDSWKLISGFPQILSMYLFPSLILLCILSL